jgi:hypothetical protein
MFTSEPEHDKHSHCADAFRYLAMSEMNAIEEVAVTKITVQKSYFK